MLRRFLCLPLLLLGLAASPAGAEDAGGTPPAPADVQAFLDGFASLTVLHPVNAPH